MFATSVQRFVYRRVLKPIFFRQDPEDTHDRVLAVGKLLGRSAATRAVTSWALSYHHPALVQNVLGMRMENPVGLTAGFDKNAELTDILPAVGFGFAEVGSITGEPCPGNPRPRLWRLPKTGGLVVWYGLKNDGCEAVATRLRGKRFAFPVGISVAKTNSPDTTDVEKGIADYAKAFAAFHDIGDYITVNISCPNAFGGEPFAVPDRLKRLLTVLDKIPMEKPVFLKVAVDISPAELDALVRVADVHHVQGFVLSNLTKRRDRPEIHPEEIRGLDKGGVSGRPVRAASNALIAHLYRTAGQRYLIIGSGGVFSAEDAYEKIRAGATLVQLATGMIFQGPQLIGEINKGLVALLQKDGYANIAQAVGAAHSP
ncbi:MAG: quinone-dependent dihydroorotate dehydrogenase [Patescibacteria group bacterium]